MLLNFLLLLLLFSGCLRYGPILQAGNFVLQVSFENGGPQASGRGDHAKHVSHKARAHARHPLRAHARRQEKDFLGGSRSQDGGGARSAQDDLVMGADGQTQG